MAFFDPPLSVVKPLIGLLSFSLATVCLVVSCQEDPLTTRMRELLPVVEAAIEVELDCEPRVVIESSEEFRARLRMGYGERELAAPWNTEESYWRYVDQWATQWTRSHYRPSDKTIYVVRDDLDLPDEESGTQKER
jgi:hypothetical protein